MQIRRSENRILYKRRMVAVVIVVNKVKNLKPSFDKTEISMLLAFGRIGESSLKFCSCFCFCCAVKFKSSFQS